MEPHGAGEHFPKSKIIVLLTALSFTMGLAAVAQAPKADVLDIIFNDDGTVVDASAMANPVRVLGNPDIKKSPMYGHECALQ